MCIQCHLHGNYEQRVQGLRDCIQDPRFERWNTTSVNHILLSVAGADGPEARSLAVELMEKFLDWYSTNKIDNYMPLHGFEVMPSVTGLRTSLIELKNRPPINLHQESLATDT